MVHDGEVWRACGVRPGQGMQRLASTVELAYWRSGHRRSAAILPLREVGGVCGRY